MFEAASSMPTLLQKASKSKVSGNLFLDIREWVSQDHSEFSFHQSAKPAP